MSSDAAPCLRAMALVYNIKLPDPCKFNQASPPMCTVCTTLWANQLCRAAATSPQQSLPSAVVAIHQTAAPVQKAMLANASGCNILLCSPADSKGATSGMDSATQPCLNCIFSPDWCGQPSCQWALIQKDAAPCLSVLLQVSQCTQHVFQQKTGGSQYPLKGEAQGTVQG